MTMKLIQQQYVLNLRKEINMFVFILAGLLTFNACDAQDEKLQLYPLEDKVGFSPIKYEAAPRFDKDLCDILFEREMSHPTPDLGDELNHPTPDLDKMIDSSTK